MEEKHRKKNLKGERLLEENAETKATKMKVKSEREQGITLIALVITIIILLILAGVTLGTALGENGLFKRAKGAVEVYDKASEKEALSLSVVNYQMGKANNENGEGGKIGTTLYDRNPGNSAKWDIVTTNDGTTYGTGWNYVEEGTNIEGYGNAKHKWAVNYETGEIVELPTDAYESNFESTVGTTEGLIFNLDAANADLGAESWGDNTKLLEYDLNEYPTQEERKANYENEEIRS